MNGALVLIADDSKLVRAALRGKLEAVGYQVLEASDGLEAARRALSLLPDIVITDLEMPVLDGTQLARLLREEPATRGTPIVVLTGHTEASLRFWSLHTGANRFFQKDRDLDSLVAVVGELLEQSSHPTGRRRDRGAAEELTPVDLLARLARLLDRKLLEATLITWLLNRATGAESLEAVSRTVFELCAEILRPKAVALVVREPGATPRAFAWIGRAASDDAVRRFVVAAAHAGGIADDVTDPVVLRSPSAPGDGGDGADLDPVYPVRLVGGRLRGVLAVVPEEPESFTDTMGEILGALSPHIGMALDAGYLAERLVELSRVDGLTGLLNHRTILERLEHEVNRHRRYGGKLSVILADIDHFKRVNDTHGHLVGDSVLHAVAETITGLLRKTDAAGRYGGEEFLVVLPGTGRDGARAVAERMRKAVADRSINAEGTAVRVTASFGVAELGEVEGSDPAALILLADGRLYEAKRGGRNRVCP